MSPDNEPDNFLTLKLIPFLNNFAPLRVVGSTPSMSASTISGRRNVRGKN